MADQELGDILKAFSTEISRTPETKDTVTVTRTLVHETIRTLKDFRESQRSHYAGPPAGCGVSYYLPGPPEMDWTAREGWGASHPARNQPLVTPEPVAARPEPGPRFTHNTIGKMVEIRTTRWSPDGLTKDTQETITGVLLAFSVSDKDTRVWIQGHHDYVQVAYVDAKDYEFTVLTVNPLA